MHAAKLDRSPRLARVLDALRANPSGLTTMEIVRTAGVCAVNSAVDELRDPINGFRISCEPVKGQKGVYRYRLEEAA